MTDAAACVLCQLFPEQVKDHDGMHHKLDIQDGQLVELPIEPPPGAISDGHDPFPPA